MPDILKEEFECSFHSGKYWSLVTWIDCNCVVDSLTRDFIGTFCLPPRSHFPASHILRPCVPRPRTRVPASLRPCVPRPRTRVPASLRPCVPVPVPLLGTASGKFRNVPCSWFYRQPLWFQMYKCFRDMDK